MTTGAAVWWALVAVEAAALALAARLALLDRTARSYRSPYVATPGIWALVALLFVALVNELTIEAVRLHLAPVPRPFAGLHLALYHLSNALVLGWPATLAASSWRVFSSPRFDHVTRRLRRPFPSSLAALLIAGAWLGWLLALVVAYPLPRASTARVLHAFEVGCVVAALAPIPLAWRRPWGVAHIGVGLLVAVEVAIAMIGPWVRDVFKTWEIASAGYLTGFGALAVYLLASWLRGRP